MPERVRELNRPPRRILKARPKNPSRPAIRPGRRLFKKTDRSTDEPGPHEQGKFTQAEWYVYWYLTVRRRLVEGIDFEFQSSLFGGRVELGGLVIDFFFPNIFDGLVINVNGVYWHRFTSESRSIDLINKIRLEGEPNFYKVVGVLEDDVLNVERLPYVVDQALLGVQLYED